MSTQTPAEPAPTDDRRLAHQVPDIYVAAWGPDCDAFEDLSRTAYVRGTAAHDDALWRRQRSTPPPSQAHPIYTARLSSEQPDLVVETTSETGHHPPAWARLFTLSVSREATGWRIELFISQRARPILLVTVVVALLAALGRINEALHLIGEFIF